MAVFPGHSEKAPSHVLPHLTESTILVGTAQLGGSWGSDAVRSQDSS